MNSRGFCQQNTSKSVYDHRLRCHWMNFSFHVYWFFLLNSMCYFDFFFLKCEIGLKVGQSFSIITWDRSIVTYALSSAYFEFDAENENQNEGDPTKCCQEENQQQQRSVINKIKLNELNDIHYINALKYIRSNITITWNKAFFFNLT